MVKNIPQTPAQKAISALQSAETSSHDAALIVCAALDKRENFEPADIALCTSRLFSTLRVIPLQDTIYRDGRNQLLIRGRPVRDAAAEKKIMDAAGSLRRNLVWKLIVEKVEFECETMHRKATSFYDNLFANAALLFAQQMNKVIADLVGEDGELEPDLDE